MSMFPCFTGKGITGLANLGNTCFINSTLQCFSHTYELNKFLMEKSYKRKLNKKPESLILVEWDKLRELMWSENCIISPGGFISSIQRVAKIKDKQIFTGFAQNDLPEFIIFLIECFHSAILREVDMNITGRIITDKDKLASQCFEMMKNMYKQEYSEILKLFYGIHVSNILSQENKTIITSTPEPYNIISLPIPNKEDVTLYDCFDLYTEKELLEGENAYFNEKTKMRENIYKEIKFWSFPEILIVDLKRFSNTVKKNSTNVKFPSEGLDLSKYVLGYERKSYIYDLYGVCNHTGNVFGGHYTSFVKTASKTWWHFNDTTTTKVPDIKNIQNASAYCFFYRKRASKNTE